MGARNRDAEHLARQHIGGGTAPADVGGACAVDARVGSLRAAQTELKYLGVRAFAKPRRRCRDECLVINYGEQCRLDELRLEYWRAYGEYGLGREDDCPLGNGADIARETELTHPVYEAFGKDAQRAQIFRVPVLDAQVPEVLDRLFEPRRHGVGIAAGTAVK